MKMDNNIELKDFIAKSIIDICLGIKEAQRTVYNEVKNVPIAPAFFSGKSQLEKADSKISFDISVSVSNTAKTDKNGGAKISVINGSINKESASKNISANKIQFSVPFYPQALENYKKDNK
jgi:hypothetical protein